MKFNTQQRVPSFYFFLAHGSSRLLKGNLLVPFARLLGRKCWGHTSTTRCIHQARARLYAMKHHLYYHSLHDRACSRYLADCVLSWTRDVFVAYRSVLSWLRCHAAVVHLWSGLGLVDDHLWRHMTVPSNQEVACRNCVHHTWNARGRRSRRTPRLMYRCRSKTVHLPVVLFWLNALLIE